MQFYDAFSYIFEDPKWGSKVALAALMGFASIAFMPMLLLGLLPLCILLGYGLEIVNNVRDDKKIILPEWDEFGDRLTRGAGVLLAVFVYNLPFWLLSACAFYTQDVLPGDLPDDISELAERAW